MCKVSEEGTCIAACLLPGFGPPPSPPRVGALLNGFAWPAMCLNSTKEHFFAIGDWGGVSPGVPANNVRDPGRHFTPAIDGQAQRLVATVFNAQAALVMCHVTVTCVEFPRTISVLTFT